CSRTKNAPTNASGRPSGSPRCTAPTSDPIATANNAGSTPRRIRTTHHAAASAASAFGSTEKNCHSLRARRAVSMGHAAEAARGHPRRAVKGAHEVREIAEADVVGHVRDGAIGAGEQPRRTPQPRTQQVLM